MKLCSYGLSDRVELNDLCGGLGCRICCLEDQKYYKQSLPLLTCIQSTKWSALYLAVVHIIALDPTNTISRKVFDFFHLNLYLT